MVPSDLCTTAPNPSGKDTPKEFRTPKYVQKRDPPEECDTEFSIRSTICQGRRRREERGVSRRVPSIMRPNAVFFLGAPRLKIDTGKRIFEGTGREIEGAIRNETFQKVIHEGMECECVIRLQIFRVRFSSGLIPS
ncbi:hypothetical protein CEXT_674171 [Caerostris extrusa]|uniref:Uncharacterized protein n=1 Tax=Caerostris extrusa TaxID=172846 RepID=A0AAV4T088_CAEEX|nr:hypothetical protein CEXT_674171 [Caerostris extrusa]